MRSAGLFSLCIVAATVCSSAWSQGTPSSNKGKVYVETTERSSKEYVVDAGAYTYASFELDEKEKLSVELDVSGGAIEVAIDDFGGLVRVQTGGSLGGTTVSTGSRSLNFVAPKRDTYNLIFDNRSSSTKRKVTFTTESVSEERTALVNLMRDFFAGGYAGYKQLFVFDDFDIHVKPCGWREDSSNSVVVMCLELIEELRDDDMLVAEHFVFLHAVAHQLLRAWNSPLHDDEHAADEFATAMLILLQRPEDAYAAAEHWSVEGGSRGRMLGLLNGRHVLTPARAKKVLGWLEEASFAPSWLEKMVPNLTGEALTSLSSEGDAGDPEGMKVAQAAKRELARRAAL